MAAARTDRLQLFLDATILIKAASFPRLPFELFRLALHGEATIGVSPLVLRSARIHVAEIYPSQLALFEQLLILTKCVVFPDPAPERVTANSHLCRDEDDIAVALAAIDAGVDYLVTNDRDLTVVDKTTIELRKQIKVITPLVLVRQLLQWPESRIEAAIHRNWHELSGDEWRELGELPAG